MVIVRECLAAAMVVLSLVGVPVLTGWHENVNRSASYPSDVRVVTLTGVATDGVWTTEEVTGYNYWYRHFPRANIRVHVGEKILLRITSADVTHHFSCPKLGIERKRVKAGQVVEVTFTAKSVGVYPYYCEAICGDCHYYMRGVIEVLPRGAAINAAAPATSDQSSCPYDLTPPTVDDPVRRGEYLYRKLGCIACHEGPGVGVGINIPADQRYQGSKVRSEWLVKFLLEPVLMRWRRDGVRPFIKMPNFHLAETQARDLAAYLLQKTDEALIPPTGIDWESPASAKQIAEGRQLYEQYQCRACHRLDGVGQRIGPAHDGVGSRLRPDYMYRWILDPQAIVPGTPMPNKGLWEEEARALVRYLQTLKKDK